MKYTHFSLGAIMALLVQGTAAHAQVNGNWLTTTAGNWSDETKWSTNPAIPGGTGSTVTIDNNTGGSRTITIDTVSRTVGIFNLGNPAGNGSTTIAGSGGGKLIFDNGLSAAQLNAVGGPLIPGNANTVSAGIELLSNLAINNSNALTLSGAITGNGSITKTGAGRLSLHVNTVNTFAGGFTLDGGEVLAANSASFGTGTVTIKSGALLSAGGARTYVNALVLDGDVAVSYGSGTASTNFNGATATLARSVTITNNEAFGILGAIGDGGSGYRITKSGTAILELKGNNTYSGGFTLNNGAVSITAAAGVHTAFGSGALTLNGGSIGSNNSRVLANNVTVGGDVNLNSAATQQIRYIGTMTLTGNRVLTNDGVVSFVDGGNQGVIGESGGSFSLTKSGAGNMTLAAGNTYTGGTIVKSGTLIIATDSLANSGSVHVDGGALALGNNVSDTVGQVKLTQGIISGATSTSILTASGYEAESGSITAVLAGASAAFEKKGSGLLEYGGAGTNTYGGGTTVTSGTLRLNASDRLPDTGVLAAAGGVLDLNGFQDTVANVTIGGGTVKGGTLSTTSLTVNGIGGGIAANTLLNVSAATSVAANASLNVSGTLGGAGGLNVAGELTGSGYVNKTVVVQDGGTLSPGNSPGTAHYNALQLEGGGNYNWQMYDATGLAGTGYDTISVTGGLNLNALSLDNPYALNLWSLSGIGPDTNGNALNFDAMLEQEWVLISAGSIDFSNLSEPINSYFSIFSGANNGTAGFANPLYGNFTVDVVGSNLVLQYVPEPSTYVLGSMGALGFAWMLRRRRRLAA